MHKRHQTPPAHPLFTNSDLSKEQARPSAEPSGFPDVGTAAMNWGIATAPPHRKRFFWPAARPCLRHVRKPHQAGKPTPGAHQYVVNLLERLTENPTEPHIAGRIRRAVRISGDPPCPRLWARSWVHLLREPQSAARKAPTLADRPRLVAVVGVGTIVVLTTCDAPVLPSAQGHVRQQLLRGSRCPRSRNEESRLDPT